MGLKEGLFIISLLIFNSDQKVIKLGTLAPEGSAWYEAYSQFKRVVEEKSEKRIKVLIYPGGVMGDEADMARKIRMGQLQAGAFTEFGVSIFIPDIRILNFLFFYRDYEEWNITRDFIVEDIKRAGENKGVIFIGWIETGPVFLYSSKDISSLEKLKNTKYWVWQGDHHAKNFFERVLSASPITLQIIDVFNALKMGLVETVYSPPYTLLSLQWAGSIKYFLSPPCTFTGGGILIDKNTFNSLEERDRALIMNAWRDIFPILKNKIIDLNKKTQDELIKNGIREIRLDDETLSTLVRRADSVNSETAHTLGFSSLYEKVKNMLNSYRKK
jgi:TRAP-type C4-dicarboxylate transport system substrate-binding protein